MEIDYKELLYKYMDLVAEIHADTFTDKAHTVMAPHPIEMTKEEADALVLMAKKIYTFQEDFDPVG